MLGSRRSRYLASGVALALCLVAGVQWYRNRPRPPLNAILITLGTTRADHLGCYGYEHAQTPAMDELAKSGVLFEKTYTAAPLTLPAHATIFTSLYPAEHGLRIDGLNCLGSDVPVLAEMVRSENYDTAAFLSSFALNSKFGLNRGFDTYDDAYEVPSADDPSQKRRRDGSSVMTAALEWLSAPRERPFFCWIHLNDPHAPYDARSDMFGDAFSDHPYDAGIAFADLQIQRLRSFLDKHRLTRRTLIVVAGDHGEGLMEHGERHHGDFLYNSTMRVPLIIAGPPFIKPGLRAQLPASLVDVTPTIMSTLRLPPKMSRFRGSSLNAAYSGSSVYPQVFHIESRLAVEEGRGKVRAGVVWNGWKYIQGERQELYNVKLDPAELNDVCDEQEKMVDDKDDWSELKQLRKFLKGGEQNMVQYYAPFVKLTPEEKQRLKIGDEEIDQNEKEVGESDSPISQGASKAE